MPLHTDVLDGTVWLIQDEIGEHSDGELNADSTRRKFRRVATNGKAYNFDCYKKG